MVTSAIAQASKELGLSVGLMRFAAENPDAVAALQRRHFERNEPDGVEGLAVLP
jgi:hypothetical protein